MHGGEDKEDGDGSVAWVWIGESVGRRGREEEVVDEEDDETQGAEEAASTRRVRQGTRAVA